MKARRSYVVAGLVIFGFALKLSYAFYQLTSIQRDLVDYTGENMLWNVMQAERETRKLANHMLLPPGMRDDEATLLQLDLLTSRVNLLKDNPQHDYLAGLAEFSQPLDGLIDDLSRLDRQRIIDPAYHLENYTRISASLDELVRLGNKVMLAQREQGGTRRDHQLKTIYLVMIFITGIMVVGGYMAWQLLANLRALDRANMALNEHSQHLEAMVEERTAALRTALENERYTNSIYKNFLTTISHQFRTPITIIDMIAQRFIRRAPQISPTVLAERAQRIRQAVHRLTMMIDSTISNDALSAKGIPLKKDAFDLRRLVESACDDHRELFPSRQLEVSLPANPLVFEGDEVLIEQIVTNFLTNAEKYSPTSEPIAIGLERQGDTLACTVSDRGIGIPAGERGQIFNRFYRASNVAHLEGTGLGLSLSQTLARLHGGELGCEPLQPQGTKFTLTLPYVC